MVIIKVGRTKFATTQVIRIDVFRTKVVKTKVI